MRMWKVRFFFFFRCCALSYYKYSPFTRVWGFSSQHTHTHPPHSPFRYNAQLLPPAEKMQSTLLGFCPTLTVTLKLLSFNVWAWIFSFSYLLLLLFISVIYLTFLCLPDKLLPNFSFFLSVYFVKNIKFPPYSPYPAFACTWMHAHVLYSPRCSASAPTHTHPCALWQPSVWAA